MQLLESESRYYETCRGVTERRIRWKNPGNELRLVANHGPRLNYRSELPVFPGPRNWERKYETYFTMNLVPDNLRTELASMNLVGEAYNIIGIMGSS